MKVVGEREAPKIVMVDGHPSLREHELTAKDRNTAQAGQTEHAGVLVDGGEGHGLCV